MPSHWVLVGSDARCVTEETTQRHGADSAADRLIAGVICVGDRLLVRRFGGRPARCQDVAEIGKTYGNTLTANSYSLKIGSPCLADGCKHMLLRSH
jgi:hypothetical protein